MEKRDKNNIKIIILIFMCFCISNVISYAQNIDNSVLSANVKVLSQAETMQVTQKLNSLSVDQSRQIYMINLRINRKFFGNQKNVGFINKSDKLYKESLLEKLLEYKKVLTNKQYIVITETINKEETKVAQNKFH